MSKTETHSEALELAEFFGSMKKSSHRWYDGVPVHEKAAAELRRLDAENKALRSAIGDACEGWNMHPDLRKLLEAALWAKPEAAAKIGGAA